MSQINRYERMLLGLRSGERDFTEVAVAMEPLFRSRAAYFIKRWSAQTLIREEDVVNILRMALWRSVDRWDPSKCPEISRFVDVQLGRAVEKALRKACAWPDERRSPPARQVYAADVAKERGGGRAAKDLAPAEVFDRLGVTVEPLQDVGLEEQQEQAFRLRSFLPKLHPRSLGRKVVEAVLEGHTIDGAADAIYANPDTRLTYELGSQEHARKVAHIAAYRVRLLAEQVAV